jgi:hypothetical protein
MLFECFFNFLGATPVVRFRFAIVVGLRNDGGFVAAELAILFLRVVLLLVAVGMTI